MSVSDVKAALPSIQVLTMVFEILTFVNTQVLAQVIRFHPKVPGVWIYAAAWEFDTNLNVAAARALMQTGLRACPTSEDLWVEYLRMELTYLNKLKARKVALGEDEGTLIREHNDPKDKQWRDENKELFMALDENRENDEASDVKVGESDKKSDLFREQGLSILRAIYSGAIDALPSSFSVRTRFMEILLATELAHSEEMQKEILADMKRDFSNNPEYWDWLARVETVGLHSTQEMSKEIMLDQLQKAIQVCYLATLLFNRSYYYFQYFACVLNYTLEFRATYIQQFIYMLLYYVLKILFVGFIPVQLCKTQYFMYL